MIKNMLAHMLPEAITLASKTRYASPMGVSPRFNAVEVAMMSRSLSRIQ